MADIKNSHSEVEESFVGKMYRVNGTEHYAILIGIPHNYHIDQMKVFDQAMLINDDGTVGYTPDHGKAIRLRFSPQKTVKFEG